MTLPPGEPAADSWRAVSTADFIDFVLRAAHKPVRGPLVVAIDGRGASGKSTLADRVLGQVRRSAVVHTDDVAWNVPFFSWGGLLTDHVLSPLRRGEPVSFSPPAWALHARGGSIEVAAGLDVVVIEGVGASQREFEDFVDATIWVQSDFVAAETRGIARDLAEGANGNEAEAVAFWHEWMNEELRFLGDQRPWERACVIVAGTSPIPLHDDQVAISFGPL